MEVIFLSEIITLKQETPSVQYLCKKDKRIAKVISMVGEITYQPHDDPFAFLVHEIIEQMLSIKAGKRIYARLEDLCGDDITPEAVSYFSEDEIRTIGTSSSKARYITGLANSVLNGDLDFSRYESMSDKEVIKDLIQFHGIGQWTAKMYLIFVLDRQDVLPYEDVAFLQGYKWAYKTDDVSKATIEKRCKKWKPYSSIAARYLYRALDEGLTKNEFHLFKGEGHESY